MKISAKNSIYQAIIHGKWLDISYVNKSGQNTKYFIGIKDIDIKKGRIYCDIFNPYKDSEVLNKPDNETFISFEGIKTASILEHSYFETPNALVERAFKDREFGEYLEIINFDNNILRYLSDCYRLDNDPFLKETVMIDGIDCHTLLNSKKYSLDENQFNLLLNRVFKKHGYEAEIMNKYSTLAINKFSIDMNDKQYVVAYKVLNLNFKDKTLRLSDKTFINKSFLITEEKKVTLAMYLNMNPDEFIENFDKNENECIESIKENFRDNEIVNTRPNIFLLARNSQRGVDEAFEAIHQMDFDNKLTFPLKSFFGRNRAPRGTSKESNIVVFNRDKINIDQMRVIYNSMVNHVTYVKGPPGTGKTETIFNVLLSAYANDKTVLVCSNNNHPVNDIFKKMDNSLTVKFAKDDEPKKIIFPILRVGNNNETIETIKQLRKVLQFAKEHEKQAAKEQYTESTKNKSLSEFNQLKELLMEYESKLDLKDRINGLIKIKELSSIDKVNKKLEEQLELTRVKYNNLRDIKDEDVMKYAISAAEDRYFQYYVYFSALLRYKKLLNETYRELREILLIDDISFAVNSFNKYIKDDANLRRLLSVFPIIVCTNLSCEKLGSAKPQFDLVIMDESGQCNIASSLIPIVRGSDLLLVGDTNQLQPVTVIEENVNEDLRNRYGVGEEYDYVHNSILSTMLRKDNNSKNILLSYHYRCGTRIASFVNQRFYGEQLKLLNKNNGELLYVNVNNKFNPRMRNSYNEEAYQIAKLIKENDYKDVGIITPFVNQAALINENLAKMGINDTKAGTIHTLQGSEKPIIIMSSALSLKTSKKTMDWIKNNHELINVGVTRAKEKFIFVGDKEAIDVLSGNEENDIKVLSDYVYENGKTVVPKSDAVISYDFSNDSKNEKEFFETVKPYFNRRGSKFRVERNVPVKDAIKNVQNEDLRLIGKKEFDVIVQVSGGLLNNRYKTVVVFEIDGGEHIGSSRTARLDRQKEDICKRYEIKLIRIPNSAVKDYESIISLFECVAKDLKDIEEAYEQLTLFEDE